MYQSKLIDLSNYSEDDLVMKELKGSVLVISTEGSATVSIKGINGALNAEYDLAIISLADFAKSSSITEEGLYAIPILGLDRVELTVGGSGKILVREMV